MPTKSLLAFRRWGWSLALLAACSRAESAPAPDPESPADATDGGLLARSLPRVVYRGGRFLRHPKLVTITFSSDDPQLVRRLEQFAGVIASSAWWREVTAGYCGKLEDCIGDGRAGASVHVERTLPVAARDSDIDSLLVELARQGRLGSLDAETLLLVYLPLGVTLTDSTAQYCRGGPRAFHRAIELEGQSVPYAVLPRCGDEAELTGSASHEILEATTNPFPAERGFAFTEGSRASGFSAAGLEPVDPCGLIIRDRHRATESGFVVHRAWSNQAAALALNPCVPAPRGQPYMMLVPREPGVRLAQVGDTATLELDASTAGSAKSWSIAAFDLSGDQDHERYVEATLDRTSVTAGERVTLSLKALKANPKQRGVVALVSTLGETSHLWPLLVMMR